MAALKGFLATVYLAVVYASLASAAPSQSSVQNFSTRYVHKIGKRNLEVVSYSPAGKFETFEGGLALPSSFVPRSLEEEAITFVQERLQLPKESIAYNNGYTSGDMSFAYLRQQHEGVKFANSVANIAIKDGNVVTFGNSFVKPTTIASSTAAVSLEDAIASAEESLNGKHTGLPSTIEYLVLEDGSAALAHVVYIDGEEATTTYKAFVDAATGTLLSVLNLGSHASYHVLPITKQYPTQGFELLKDPQDLSASPKGWHYTSSGITNSTSGNNVDAYINSSTNLAVQSASGLVFNYKYSSTSAPTTQANQNAVRTNVFYVINSAHDVWYKYGFDEKAYNFQRDNFGKGGLGGDPVFASIQDPLGFTNNAMFTTFPEGMPGLMRMFLWDVTTPMRDGAMENDIVVHEYGHGLTSRLTGGGSASCLGSTEARGLGEGWSDTLAAWFTQGATMNDYELGVWAGGVNIRRYPHTTDAKKNPLRYRNIADSESEHDIGEVWANTLHNVHFKLREKHGYSADARTNPASTGGNTVFLHLLIDSLKIQPCDPTFVNARDAIIQADVNRYKGANKCLLWKAFASRGMGTGAKQSGANYVDSTAVPAGC
ncbi:metalloprotease [Pterulicium gracile]|uniref:Extracellular metalloproteinase n=1 Tax=Pterulicium gracile TaxID=1884261 RepID=A0A5C3QYA5_9AGAR|nr:metalloprotease [Pterula gracilis]